MRTYKFSDMIWRSFFVLMACAMAAAVLAPATPNANAQETSQAIHDPVMAKEGDRYYVFGTGRGVIVASSADRVTWDREPAVLEGTPEWVLKILPDFGNRGSFWAPDIYHHNGTYYLYYSVSSFGRNNSGIGVATNTTLNSKSPEFKWVDRGMVVNSVAGRDMWNAIDPHVMHDEAGIPWMSFGSHWGGLKLVRLDASLIKLPASPADWEWHTIAARHRYHKLDDRDAGDSANPELNYEALYPAEILALNQASENGAIEAPFIFRKNGYYYQFVSWDRCCRGANSTYKVVVGRSRDIRGPYVDREDERMDWGGGTLVVTNFAESPRWAAGGHNSVYTWDDKDYLVFHAYEHEGRGASRLVIKEIKWDAQGWPTVTLDE